MTKEELRIKKNEFIETLKLEELAHKTIISYENAIDKLIDYLPDEFILNKMLIINWKNSLINNYSLKTRNQFIVVNNKFLKYLGFGDSENKEKDYNKLKKELKSQILQEYNGEDCFDEYFRDVLTKE